jgi:hypothetical protein
VLTNYQGDIEKVIWKAIYNFNDTQRSEINAAIRALRDALMRADEALGNNELGHAETACEESETALVELHRIRRALGIVHEP